MTKRQKDRQYNDQKTEGLYCVPFCLLVIVLSALLSFGHCVVCPSVFWSLYCLSFKDRRTDNTMTKRQKGRQYNDQKTRADNTMT
jgi:hypothetical protein